MVFLVGIEKYRWTAPRRLNSIPPESFPVGNAFKKIVISYGLDDAREARVAFLHD